MYVCVQGGGGKCMWGGEYFESHDYMQRTLQIAVIKTVYLCDESFH